MKKERNYENQELKNAVDAAKRKGYKVYTFESTGNISQIFVECPEKGIGSISAYYSGIQFSTMHKSVNNGSGFGSLISEQEFNNIEDIDIIFIYRPYWSDANNLYKYKSMQDYINKGLGILTYYQL